MFMMRPFPTAPCSGLFAWIALRDPCVKVSISSAHPVNYRIRSGHALFSGDSICFGTQDQSRVEEPWISITLTQYCIRPEGVGLKHGWADECDDSDTCKNFVVEASLNNGEWIQLLECAETPLSRDGNWFKIPEVQSRSGRYFDCFRIRMTGPNSSNRWYLMIGWFDVWGKMANRSLHLL